MTSVTWVIFYFQFYFIQWNEFTKFTDPGLGRRVEAERKFIRTNPVLYKLFIRILRLVLCVQGMHTKQVLQHLSVGSF